MAKHKLLISSKLTFTTLSFRWEWEKLFNREQMKVTNKWTNKMLVMEMIVRSGINKNKMMKWKKRRTVNKLIKSSKNIKRNSNKNWKTTDG